MASVKNYFSPEEQQQIIEKIRTAELLTSGEIKLHLEEKCGKDVLHRAALIFKKLKLHQTEHKNGVLIYLALKDKKFAILGDAGINKVVPGNFWEEIKTNMQKNFSNGNFITGITSAIEAAGKQLADYFPVQSDDTNELSNEISFDNE